MELVDKFCYLGDMLSVDGDADAAVEARIKIGWNKFRQLVPLLTNKDVGFTGRPSDPSPRRGARLVLYVSTFQVCRPRLSFYQHHPYLQRHL